MKGSIRVLVGFLIVFGAVGGIDNSTDSALLGLTAIACVGLVMMLSGIKAMKS
jgi:hypothetical protein